MQDQDKFVIRLPNGMRERIKAAAFENKRSMNAEIVATLLEVYPEEALPIVIPRDEFLDHWANMIKGRDLDKETWSAFQNLLSSTGIPEKEAAERIPELAKHLKNKP